MQIKAATRATWESLRQAWNSPQVQRGRASEWSEGNVGQHTEVVCQGMEPGRSHWALALAIAFAVACLSTEEDAAAPDQLHVWAGYAVGAILVIWGFIGMQHARFSGFVTGPLAAMSYLADELQGRARRVIGHNPTGTAMIVALLISLTGTVGTGLVAYGNAGHGPLANATGGLISSTQAEGREGSGREGNRSGEGAESVVGELHAALANIVLGLIGLHLMGVGLASFTHRENLVTAMLTGRKRAD